MAEDPEHYLFERYVRAEPDGEPLALRTYYAVRPLIPRRVQLGMRRVYARRQARREFPRWPIEPILVERHHAELRERLDAAGAERLPVVGYWPEHRRFAFVLTHDVESEAGVANIPRVREVEARHGIVSSWNFCAEEYPIRDGVFDELRDAGCEIGLHGVDHRCKTFGSRERFESDLPTIHRYLREWDVAGFRSPALHRNADWMPELGCEYDSSFPDTDPFEPQPGGCCSVFPFLNEGLVELPVTLVQDHTLWEILRHPTNGVWEEKIRWIREVGGLVNVIVHPDYLLSEERLDRYDQLLRFLRAQEGGWHALPRDVARWWRAREAATLAADGSGAERVTGVDGWDATVAYARADGDGIVVDP